MSENGFTAGKEKEIISMNFMEKAKPIGVFDSGIGGLTVVKRLAATLPFENIVYFGDTARVPYGPKSNETVIEYGLEAAGFLMHKNVKAIVVACNTVSSVAIPELRKRLNVPVIGMIEPGVAYAGRVTSGKRIGVIGTRGTVGNKAYSQALKAAMPDAFVVEKACPLLVPLVEEGWVKHEVTKTIAREYLTELIQQDIDTLILGCTHYPVLLDVIRQIMGGGIALVDSGVAAADVVRSELNRIGLETNANSLGRTEFFVTDIPTTFREVAQIFLDQEIKEILRVDLEFLKELKAKFVKKAE